MGSILSPQTKPADSGVAVENDGAPLSGGPFTTLDLEGVTATDEGGGVVHIEASGPTNTSIYGTGMDGNLAFDGVATISTTGVGGLSLAPSSGIYVLDRDIVADNMTIASGVEVRTQGYGVFVKNTLTVDGILGERTGNGGNGSSGGTGGTAGAVIHNTSARRYFGGRAGGAGGSAGAGGSNSTGPSSAPLGGATSVSTGDGGVLQGGKGGQSNTDSGSNTPGGGGGALGFNQFDSVSIHLLTNATTGRAPNSGSQWEGGSGGGGGSGARGAGTGGGGGGGAAGCGVGVFARVITGSGVIRAIGGNGGNGALGGGGGGGGGGGVLIVCTNSEYPLSVTLSAAGGTGGAAGGSSGTTAGGNGGPGIVVQYRG